MINAMITIEPIANAQMPLSELQTRQLLGTSFNPSSVGVIDRGITDNTWTVEFLDDFSDTAHCVTYYRGQRFSLQIEKY